MGTYMRDQAMSVRNRGIGGSEISLKSPKTIKVIYSLNWNKDGGGGTQYYILSMGRNGFSCYQPKTWSLSHQRPLYTTVIYVTI